MLILNTNTDGVILENLESRVLLSDGALIITSSILEPAFQEVADWYTRKGYPAEVVNTTHIANTYQGIDIQEQIRNCIRDYHDNKDIEYVLLGGDDSVVPDRNTTVNVSSYITFSMPTDLYYASLEGTWNDDGDWIHGEVEDNIQIKYDVVVARYPIREAEHVATMLTKVKAYEMVPPTQNWANRMLNVGVELWDHLGVGTHNNIYYYYNPSDAEVKTRTAYTDVQNYWDTSNAHFFFDSCSDWDLTFPGDYDLTPDNLVSVMGNGYQFMNVTTHGHIKGWLMESDLYFSSDFVENLTETVNMPIISTIACDTGAFDMAEPSLSEAFLRSDMTGTIAYLGCSRYGWGYEGAYLGPSINYSYQLYKEFLEGNKTILGDAFVASKEFFAIDSLQNGQYRWIQFGLNLQGDPLIQMYRNDPVAISPIYDNTINEGPQEIQISNITEGSRVCLWQGDNLYVVDQADSQGVFRYQIDPDIGVIQLTIVSIDAPVYVAEIIVDGVKWQLLDGSLTIYGTTNDDVFEFQPETTEYKITLNDTTWLFNLDTVQTINFDSLTGNDTVTLTGSSEIDIVTLEPGQVTLISKNYLVSIVNAEIINVFGGLGDLAYLYDSDGNDSFYGSPEYGSMIGNGFSNSVNGFDYVYAYASNGLDTVSLYDSDGDDTFCSTVGWSNLYGVDFYQHVTGFDETHVYATGGFDTAYFFDFSADYLFEEFPTYAHLINQDFANYIYDFDKIHSNITVRPSSGTLSFDLLDPDLL